MEQQQSEPEPDFWDVRFGSHDMEESAYHFPNTERGKRRAIEYRDAFNADFRKALGLREDEVDLRMHEHMSEEEYDKACAAEAYRTDKAFVVPGWRVPVVADDAPLPTDYPHNR